MLCASEIAAEDHTVITYQYRDGSNFKVTRSALLQGRCEVGDDAIIRQALPHDLIFIPESVGLESLQHEFDTFGNVPNDDDHVWHEYLGLRPANDIDFAQLNKVSTKAEMIRRFHSSDIDDECLSPLAEDFGFLKTKYAW